MIPRAATFQLSFVHSMGPQPSNGTLTHMSHVDLKCQIPPSKIVPASIVLQPRATHESGSQTRGLDRKAVEPCKELQQPRTLLKASKNPSVSNPKPNPKP